MPACAYLDHPDQLRQLLAGDLPEGEQAKLTAHLETCPDCRSTLDALAARSGYWNDLALLQDHDFDPPTRDFHEKEPLDDEEVPLGILEPTDGPGLLGKLGPYDILRVIGRGGMGVVFQARDRALDRLVAIKVLTPGMAATAAARRRFAREAKAAAAVVHEHVVTIHAVDVTPQGIPYLVMQYIAGKSVQDLIDQGRQPELREILRIGSQAAKGLAAAHAQGLIHRDIKPANILLENGVERVKITDFGLARAVDDATMTQSGVVAGTPQYMSPEQARGDAFDHRADLFSLGSVLYALCTGRAPFRGSSSMGTLKRVCERVPEPIGELNPDIPAWLIKIISRLHAKDPAERYATADEVAELLGRCLAHVQQPSTVPLPAELTGRPKRRRFAAWAALSVGIVLAAALTLTNVRAMAQHAADYVATVLRLKTPEGVLVVETQDPGIGIKLDGSEMIVTGAGVKEIRIAAGPHSVQALKAGKVLREELVTITRGGRSVLTIRREPDDQPPPTAASGHVAPPLISRVPKNVRQETMSQGVPSQSSAPADEELKVRIEEEFRKDPAVMALIAQISEIRDHLEHVKSLARGPNDTSRVIAQKQLEKLVADYADLWETKYNALSKRVRIRMEEAFKKDPAVVALIARISETRDHLEHLKSLARHPNDTDRVIAQKQLDKLVADYADLRETNYNELSKRFRIGTGTSNDSRDLTIGEHPTGRFTRSPRGGAVAPSDKLYEALVTPAVPLVNPVAPRLLLELKGLGAEVRSVAFSSDGRVLAYGAKDGMIGLWEWKSFVKGGPAGQGQVSLLSHVGGVECVAFAPDGKTLASAGWDHHVKRWKVAGDPPSPRLVWDFAGFDDGVRAVAFSPDGQHLAAGGFDRILTVLEAKTGLRVWTSPTLDQPINGVQFSPNGQLLALALGDYSKGTPGDPVGQPGEVQLWNWPGREHVATMRGWTRECKSVAFSPAGRMLAATSGDGTTRLYDVASRREMNILRSGSFTAGVAFRPDRPLLATSNWSGEVIFWETPIVDRALFQAHHANIPCLAFTPDSQILATAGADGSIKLWDASDKAIAQLTKIRHDPVQETRPVAENQDFRVFTELLKSHPPRHSGTDGIRMQLYIRDLVAGGTALIADEPLPGLIRTSSPNWSSDGRRIIFHASPAHNDWQRSEMIVLEARDGKPSFRSIGPGNCPAYSPDDRRIAFLVWPGTGVGQEHGVWLMNADGAERHRVANVVGAPFWSPDGDKLMINNFSEPTECRLLDLTTGKQELVEVPGYDLISWPRWISPWTIVAVITTGLSDEAIVELDVTTPAKAKIVRVLWNRRGIDLLPRWPLRRDTTGQFLFVGVEGANMRKLYQLPPGENGKAVPMQPEARPDQLEGLFLSPDGRYLLFNANRPDRR